MYIAQNNYFVKDLVFGDYILLAMQPSRYGQRIRQARKSKGLNQTQAAELLGKKQSEWSKWETGKVNLEKMEIGTVTAVADLLDVTVDYILCRDYHEVEYSTAEDFSEFLHILARIVATDNRKNFLRSLIGMLQLAAQKTHGGKEGIAEALGRLAELSEKYRNKP